MDNLYDYLYWRGDISFEVIPPNEIDFAIFSLLSYINFLDDMELKADYKSYNLFTLENYMKKNGYLKIEQHYPNFKKQCIELLSLVALKKRYKDVKVFGYSFNFEKINTLQFAAISFELPNNEIVISYRGTDTSLLGWKEDFMMSFKKFVGAQENGLHYLKNLLNITNKNLYIVGHSKGGNIALYSALKIQDMYNNRILGVYSFDGPGFNEKTLKDFENSDIRHKMITLVPQGSVIGILMQHEEPIEIVYSNKRNKIAQHAIFSWQVEIDKFKRIEERAKGSLIFDKSIRTWLEKLDEKDMENFIESLFDTTECLKIEDISELKLRPLKTIYSLLSSCAINNSQNRKLVEKVIGSLMESMKVTTVEEYRNKKETLINQFKKNKKMRNEENKIDLLE